MKKIINIIICTLTVLILSCNDNSTPNSNENAIITIDTVYGFMPGEGQNSGQDSAFYPENIFGLPIGNSDITFPANSPEQILSIGLDGEIIVGFKNYFIVDKEGYDFIIFENVFLNPVNSKYFIEPAEVSVSQDGINFIAFPYDSLTFIGCAGITPTLWNPKDVNNSSGDRFDLSILGLNYITQIKIKDISKRILSNPQHPNYDPIISGFDLDAVIGINFERLK
ncbi:MAG: hypothetical protein V1779_01030 [bacterium]